MQQRLGWWKRYQKIKHSIGKINPANQRGALSLVSQEQTQLNNRELLFAVGQILVGGSFYGWNFLWVEFSMGEIFWVESLHHHRICKSVLVPPPLLEILCRCVYVPITQQFSKYCQNKCQESIRSIEQCRSMAPVKYLTQVKE